MSDQNQLRHYATYRNDEYIVVGHNPSLNNCMVVKVAALPQRDQQRLRAIASSKVAQTTVFNLTPVLQKEHYDQNIDWFSFLASQLQRRGGPVMVLPLKEIQDSLEPNQRAEFKGYGKRAFSKSMGKSVVDESAEAEDTVSLPPSNSISHADTAGITGQIENLAAYVVDEMGENKRVLNQILSVLERAFPAPEAVVVEPPAKAKTKK